ncbi:MAG: hypothetical protein CMB13_05290 [Euryarchaeota archaeon]|nr:hypothetical protein [Euryarchaeota archaeon]
MCEEIGENMIWQLMERLNDNPAAILLLPLSIICLGGAIPLMREHSRRRSIERALPEMLELISAELGAGLGLEQAFADVAKSRNDEAGKLLDLALERAQATSFSAALARFAIETRSSMVQRVVNLLDAALEQNAPLQDVTYRMSIEYEKLNTLLRMKEEKVFGQAFTMIILMALMLPVITGFIVGVFAGPATGYPLGSTLNALYIFSAAATGVTVVISGRMLDRLGQYVWVAPLGMFISTVLFQGVYLVAGNLF